MPRQDTTQGSRETLRRRRGCGTFFFCIMVSAAAVWGTCLGAFVWVLDEARTSIKALDEYRPKIGSKVFSADGELLGEFTTESRELVSLSEMPLHLQKAFIATEDDAFFEHRGVRLGAIVNAAVYMLQTGRVRGGSTITQQLARNIEPLDVGQERTVQRKLREAATALLIERQFTKDEILELYLNQIFLGISAHGVEAAAQQYFAKPSTDLTLAEAALLAGLTRAPNKNEPFTYPDNARSRRTIVLRQMLHNGFITQQEYDAAVEESVEDSVVTPEERASLDAEHRKYWGPNRFHAPYFAEEVRGFILRRLAKDEVFEDGLEIHTTLDMRLQQAAEKVLFAALDEFDAKKLENLKKAGREDEFVPVSGALVCLDNRPPHQGFVRALVGGRDFQKQKFNMATQAKRQPGSSIKPFVWAAAIDNRMTPSTIVIDEPFQRRDGAGRLWDPQNFGGKHEGPITLRRALEKSINIVSIKIVEQLGMPTVRSYLQRAGFREPIDDVVGLTLGLGTPETTVLDQCVVYSAIADGGLRYDPVMITEIRDRDGFPAYEYAREAPVRAFPEDVAYVVTYLLQGVCSARGTGARTLKLGRPCAGKTGTTNDSRNVWFCGFTPEYTCVVWLGYSDNRPLGRGKDYTGGRLACPVWTEFMRQAHEGIPISDFRPPPTVRYYQVDLDTGVLEGSFREAFVEGTSPPLELPPEALAYYTGEPAASELAGEY